MVGKGQPVAATPRRSKRQRNEEPSAEKPLKKRSVHKDNEEKEDCVTTPSKAAVKETIVPDPAEMLDREVLIQAATALLAHSASKAGEEMSDGEDENTLDMDEDYVYISIALKTAPKRATMKPRTVPLVHPIFEAGEDDVCFFVKDPQRDVKDLVARRGVKSVTKVLGVTKLEKRYGTHEAKRELLDMYDLFLVDDRVAKMMPRLLGSAFVRDKKMPLVIRMDRDVPNGISRALSSTAFAPGKGTMVSVRVAKSSFTPDQIAENVAKATESIAAVLPGNWAAFQTISVRTKESPSLPVFLSVPEAKDFEPTPADIAAKKDVDRRKRKEKAVKDAKAAERGLRKQAKEEKRLARMQKLQERRNARGGKKTLATDSEVEDSDEDSDGVEKAIMASFAAGEADFEMSDEEVDSDSDTVNDDDVEDVKKTVDKSGSEGASGEAEEPDNQEKELENQEEEPEPAPKETPRRPKRKQISDRPLMRSAKDARVKKRMVDKRTSPAGECRKKDKSEKKEKSGSKKKAKSKAKK